MQITGALPLLVRDHCTVTWVLHPGGEAQYYLGLCKMIQVYDINTAQLREPGSCKFLSLSDSYIMNVLNR